jgi:hypothetical protein
MAAGNYPDNRIHPSRWTAKASYKSSTRRLGERSGRIFPKVKCPPVAAVVAFCSCSYTFATKVHKSSIVVAIDIAACEFNRVGNGAMRVVSLVHCSLLLRQHCGFSDGGMTLSDLILQPQSKAAHEEGRCDAFNLRLLVFVVAV